MISKELRTEINAAIEADNATRLSELLEQHNLGVNDQMLRLGKTVLMHSAEHGATNCMQLLLARPDIDVNAVDKDIDSTALMYAVRHEQTESVRLLIAREDLNINQQNHDGGNVMDLTAICKSAECLKLLLSHEGLDIGNNGRTSISHSAHNHNPELVKLLLQLGFDIDSTGDSSLTALMLSAQRDRALLVKLLLDNGADINLTDEKGESALKKAIEHVDLIHDFATGGDAWHESDCIRLLVSYGAELPDAVTTSDITTIPKTRLDTCAFAKNFIASSLAEDTALAPEVKTLAEKITTQDVFSLMEPPARLLDETFLSDSIAQAKITAQEIWDRISGYEESTQEFIINNVHFIDFSLGENFKSWNAANVGAKTTLVNLAYVCGGQVKHIESLMGSRPQKIEKFIKLIPIDEAGDVLEYSAEELKLSAVSKHPWEALGAAIDNSDVGTIAAGLISSFLSADDVVSALNDTTLTGDGLAHGPADAEA
jgi:ankyrin repeat protein